MEATPDFRVAEMELEARKAQRGETSIEERVEAGRLRTEAFGRATQGRGLPFCRDTYGNGKPKGEK